MDQRRWENLEKDCLLKVFEKVDMESLLLDIPFVCKSWHKETLSPSCWKSLIFPVFEPEFPFEYDYPIYDRFVSEFSLDRKGFSETAFIKFVVNRSQGNAISLKLPGCCTIEAFEYAANACPNLLSFGLPRCLLWNEDINPELIGKFNNLFLLSLGSCDNLERVLAVVSKHCKLFYHLKLCNAQIGKEEATAIVNLVPDIKVLSISRAHIDRDSLIVLLKGCKELLFLDAKDCIGFNEDDDEIAKLASHIGRFCSEGSKERFEFPFDLFSGEFLSQALSSLSEEFASIFEEVNEEAEVDGEGDGEADDVKESVEEL